MTADMASFNLYRRQFRELYRVSLRAEFGREVAQSINPPCHKGPRREVRPSAWCRTVAPRPVGVRGRAPSGRDEFCEPPSETERVVHSGGASTGESVDRWLAGAAGGKCSSVDLVDVGDVEPKADARDRRCGSAGGLGMLADLDDRVADAKLGVATPPLGVS
jgi:hypothetical protein